MGKSPKIIGKATANTITIFGAFIFLVGVLQGMASLSSNGVQIIVSAFLICLLLIALASIIEHLAYIRFYLSKQVKD